MGHLGRHWPLRDSPPFICDPGCPGPTTQLWEPNEAMDVSHGAAQCLAKRTLHKSSGNLQGHGEMSVLPLSESYEPLEIVFANLTKKWDRKVWQNRLLWKWSSLFWEIWAIMQNRWVKRSLERPRFPPSLSRNTRLSGPALPGGEGSFLRVPANA